MESLPSMILFGEGFVTGIMLTVMLGPVTMIIIRYGLQVNRIAGIWAAAGTWVSDLFFIGLTFWMTTSIDKWSSQPGIRLTLFLAGGLGLMMMGLLMLRIKQRPINENRKTIEIQSGYARAFTGGFLINSLSPFTLFFWLGAAVFVHLQSDDPLTPVNPLWYYTGVMMSLALGDFTKAWLAPNLTVWLKEKHVNWVQKVAGILIACTGLYIMMYGIFE